MADIKKTLSENADGEFFVDSSCINCGTCRKFASTTFGDSGQSSYVAHQPESPTHDYQAMQALVACPVHAIGMKAKKIPKEVIQSFPFHVDGGVYVNGFNAESSYGADSYFIESPDGNWLIDSPRFTPSLVGRFREMGGIKYIFLTHRDDVADADKYAKAFGAKRIIHQQDSHACSEAEIILKEQNDLFIGEARIIFTPGHTEGHCVLLWKNRFLFTGDHLPWLPEETSFRPFSKSCWYSWKEQIKSVQKLADLVEVEWVLPGHGHRWQRSQRAFPLLVGEAVEWMQRI